MSEEERTKTLINNIKLNINEQNVYEFGLCVEQWKQILDYIGDLQQENKQLKDKFNQILEEINWVKDLIDTCEYVDTNAITIYKIIKGDSNE